MIRNRGRQEALAIEGVNGETEDIDIVELLLKTLGKGEILPYGIGNIVVIELAKFDVRHPDIGMPLCRMGQRQVSAVILPNIVSGQECGIFGSFIRCEQTWKARSTGFEKNLPDSCNKKVSVRILFQKFPCVDGSGCKHVGAQGISAFQSLGHGAVLRHPRNLERNIAGGTELDGCTQSHELVFLQSAYDKSLTLTAIVPHRHSGIYSVGQSQMVSEICVINGEQTVRNDYSVIQTLEPRCIHPDNFTVYDAAMGIDSKGHELWNDLNFRFLKFFLATGAGAANYSPAPPATYATVAARFSSGKRKDGPKSRPLPCRSDAEWILYLLARSWSTQ